MNKAIPKIELLAVDPKFLAGELQVYQPYDWNEVTVLFSFLKPEELAIQLQKALQSV